MVNYDLKNIMSKTGNTHDLHLLHIPLGVGTIVQISVFQFSRNNIFFQKV